MYALLGGGLWLAFLLSGVHPTIAGVLAALTIPARSRLSEWEFIGKARTFLKEFENRTAQHEETVLANAQQAEAAKAVEVSSALVQTPLQRLEHALQPWVSFGIMPMFALANAGVTFGGDSTNTLTEPVSLGILLGLLLGKPIGITLFTWATVQFGWGELPEKVSWRQILGVWMIAGIGFTMSLFITNLAFTESALVASAKMGILIASLVAGIAGWVILKTSHAMNQIGIQGASAMPLGRIQVLNGPVAGKELPLTRPLITLGRPGAQVAVILRRPQGYSLIHIKGKNDYGPLYPIVNGEPIGAKAFSLQDQDIIEIAGIKMEFTLNERRVS